MGLFNSALPDFFIHFRFVVSPASEEMLVPAEEVEELQTEKIVSTAVIEELPPSPVPVQEPVPLQSSSASTTPVEKKKSVRDWLAAEGDALSHHLTIGPHGGIDWVSFLLYYFFTAVELAFVTSWLPQFCLSSTYLYLAFHHFLHSISY